MRLLVLRSTRETQSEFSASDAMHTKHCIVPCKEGENQNRKLLFVLEKNTTIADRALFVIKPSYSTSRF